MRKFSYLAEVWVLTLARFLNNTDLAKVTIVILGYSRIEFRYMPGIPFPIAQSQQNPRKKQQDEGHL